MKRFLLITALLLTTSPAWAGPIPPECRGFKQAAPYAECIIRWQNVHLRPTYMFPDLLDRQHAARRDIAARFDRGEISKAEADAEGERVGREIYREGQRRIDRQYGVGRSPVLAPSPTRTECVGIDFGGGISTLSCD